MTWRAFSYTLLVLLAVVAIATTASLAVPVDEGATSLSTVALAVQPQPQTDPGTRLVVLIVGITAIIVTYRRALVNLRSKS